MSIKIPGARICVKTVDNEVDAPSENATRDIKIRAHIPVMTPTANILIKCGLVSLVIKPKKCIKRITGR